MYEGTFFGDSNDGAEHVRRFLSGVFGAHVWRWEENAFLPFFYYSQFFFIWKMHYLKESVGKIGCMFVKWIETEICVKKYFAISKVM